MAYRFPFGQVFEFLALVGANHGLTVRQDKIGGLTIVNESAETMVVSVQSECNFYQISLKPGKWIHIHGFNSENYTLTVKVMQRIIPMLEARHDISFETVQAAKLLSVLGILPLFFGVEEKAEFQLTISNEMAA